jgi:hypothetical protein
MFDTAYISKKLPLCPAEAAGITDLWHRSLEETSIGSRYVRASRGLWVGAEMSSESSDPYSVRHSAGVLFVLGRPVRIELEIAQWSETETTVAIRPRAGMSILGTERYATAADRALEAVVEALARTKASASARTSSYRTVRDALLDRKFQWPARTGRDSVPFPAPVPAVSRYGAVPAYSGDTA